jgi:hypothetical protein
MTSRWERRRYITKIFVRKPVGEKSLGKHRHRWREITMGQDTEFEDVKLNHWLRTAFNGRLL